MGSSLSKRRTGGGRRRARLGAGFLVHYDGRLETSPLAYERIDLHVHSHFSDGALSPEDVVALAAQRQVQLLALTDHDTLAGCEAAARACAQRGIAFLYGSELTAAWRGREIHVVGLHLDPQSPSLAGQLSAVVAQRIERLRAIGERLDRCGLPGRPLVAEVLALRATPTRLHLARLLVAQGHARDVDEAFTRWLGHGRPAAVPPPWPGIEVAIGAISAAGGVAVLAHPQRYRLSAGALRELCGEFHAAGGQGIEVSLPGMSPQDASRMASLARRFGLAGSCGSDFHLPGLPWRPLGRFAKLPEGVVPISERVAAASQAP
jgi:predicted metal-dependent phosphoesterase TrpH